MSAETAKQLKVRIYADGRIEADVVGVKGPACTDYIELLEQLLDAETVDSAYTPEYYETEQVEQVELAQDRTIDLRRS